MITKTSILLQAASTGTPGTHGIPNYLGRMNIESSNNKKPKGIVCILKMNIDYNDKQLCT